MRWWRAFDVGRLRVEAVDHIGVARTQGRRQPSVAAADVDHEPSLDFRGFQNLAGGRVGQA